MYLPIFIAILLGLVSSSDNSYTNKNGSVYISTNEPPSTSSLTTDSIPPDDDGTGGENGQLPPPRPKP